MADLIRRLLLLHLPSPTEMYLARVEIFLDGHGFETTGPRTGFAMVLGQVEVEPLCGQTWIFLLPVPREVAVDQRILREPDATDVAFLFFF